VSSRSRHAVGVATPLAIAIFALAAPAALADQRITAGLRERFTTPTLTIAQGETVTFQNNDLEIHDVSALDSGPDGKPLFSSATIGPTQHAPVDGTVYLTTGRYAFNCTIHPYMRGTLVVTSAGTPQPRPVTQPPPPTGNPAGTPRAKRHRHHHRKHHRARHRHRRR
jgi:plastocyanin